MTIYLAARYKRKDDVLRYYEQLEAAGHEITTKWTHQDSIKPYQENRDKAQIYVAQDFGGILDADVFILLADRAEDARGCYIELGYVLREAEERPIKIIVVDPSDSPSIFFMDERIELVGSFEEVLERL